MLAFVPALLAAECYDDQTYEVTDSAESGTFCSDDFWVQVDFEIAVVDSNIYSEIQFEGESTPTNISSEWIWQEYDPYPNDAVTCPTCFRLRLDKDVTGVGAFEIRTLFDYENDGEWDQGFTWFMARHEITDPLTVLAVTPDKVASSEQIVVSGTGFCPGFQDNTLTINGQDVLAIESSENGAIFPVPSGTPDATYNSTLTVDTETAPVSVEVASAFAFPQISSQEEIDGFVHEELLVVYDPASTQMDIDSVTTLYSLGDHQYFSDTDLYRVLVPGVTGASLQSLAANVEADSRVHFALVSELNEAHGDTSHLPDSPWPLGEQGTSVDLSLLEATPPGIGLGAFPNQGEGVRIVVIDGGVDKRTDINYGGGFSLPFGLPGNDDDSNCNRHGTKIASIAASNLNAGDQNVTFPVSGVGVAPEATVVSYRVAIGSSSAGECVLSSIYAARALGWAFFSNQPTVINLSYGLSQSATFWKGRLEAVASRPWNTSRPIVVSAPDDFGTNGLDGISGADASSDVLSIQSVGSRVRSATFDGVSGTYPVQRDGSSHYGSGLDWIAPNLNPWTNVEGGVQTYRTGGFTEPSSYETDGTSFAAPIVSGLNALILGEFPTLTAKETEARLSELFTRAPDLGFLSSLVIGDRCDNAATKPHCEEEFGRGTPDTSAILTNAGPYRVFERPFDDTVNSEYTEVHDTGTWVNWKSNEIVRFRDESNGKTCVPDGTVTADVRSPDQIEILVGDMLDIDYETSFNGDNCFHPGDSEVDLTPLFDSGDGVYRVGLLIEPDAGGTTADNFWIDVLPCGDLCDYFDRADGSVGNGWNQLTGGNRTIDISGYTAEMVRQTNSGETSGLYQSIPSGSSTTVSGIMLDSDVWWGGGKYAGYYDYRFTIDDDGSGTGYGLRFFHDSSAGAVPAYVYLIENDQIVDTWEMINDPILSQGSVDFEFTVSSDGNIIGTVSNGVGAELFTFPAYAIQASGGNFTLKMVPGSGNYLASVPPSIEDVRVSVTP